MKNLVNATGVYMMLYDKKRKIPVSEEEDEFAHLIDEKVLRYISYCEDHKTLLKNKFLEPNVGVTYDLVAPREEGGSPEDPNKLQDENNNDQQENSEQREVKEVLPNYKEIQEVVGSEEGKRIKFFSCPRLGSYLAVDTSYKSSLSQNSLISAIENLKEYEKNLAAYEERKREYEAQQLILQKEREKLEAEAGGNQEDNNLIQENPQDGEGFIEEKVELQEYTKEEKKVIFSLDTLGQDRCFTDKEKKFIFETVKVLSSSWQGLEERLLLKDRDLKIEMDNLDRNLREVYTPEKLEADEEKYIKEYFASEKFAENPILDERIKTIETDLTRAKFIINSFFEEESMHKIFNMYSEFEFVEHERLFQNTLYFVRINNSEINEENTNKLEWKKAKKFWNESVLKYLHDFNPLGSKPGVLPHF
jgi:hypothetical protein